MTAPTIDQGAWRPVPSHGPPAAQNYLPGLRVLAASALLSLTPYVLTLNAAFKTTQADLSPPPPGRPPPGDPPQLPPTIAVSTSQCRALPCCNAARSVAFTAGQVFFCSLAAYAFARLVPRPGPDILGFPHHLDGAERGDTRLAVPDHEPLRPGRHLPGHYLTLPIRHPLRDLPDEAVLQVPCPRTWRRPPGWTAPHPRPSCGGSWCRCDSPVITTATVAFVFGWNNFLWPLIVTDGDPGRSSPSARRPPGGFAAQRNLVLAARGRPDPAARDLRRVPETHRQIPRSSPGPTPELSPPRRTAPPLNPPSPYRHRSGTIRHAQAQLQEIRGHRRHCRPRSSGPHLRLRQRDLSEGRRHGHPELQ